MGPDGQFEGVICSGCEMVRGAPITDLTTAAAQLESACQPAETRRLEMALGELSMLCKSRAEETDDVAARIAIFCAKLSEYPADVALEAIKQWGDSEKWFPAWAELRTRCDMLGSRRLATRRAVLEAVQADKPRETESRGDRLHAIYSSYLKHFGPHDERTARAKLQLNEYRPDE